MLHDITKITIVWMYDDCLKNSNITISNEKNKKIKMKKSRIIIFWSVHQNNFNNNIWNIQWNWTFLIGVVLSLLSADE